MNLLAMSRQLYRIMWCFSRRNMSTIYLQQHGTEVSKDGGRLLIKTVDGVTKSIPVSYADCLVVMASVQITHAAIMEILNNGGSIIYTQNDGSIAGELGTKLGRPRSLVRQLKCYMDLHKRQYLASRFVKSKLQAERNFLSVKYKQHKTAVIKNAISKLSALIKIVSEEKCIEKLMGIEGIAAKTYFDTFSILLEGSGYTWYGRRRRPAPDCVNAMLSFGYSLLEKDIRRIISAAVLAKSIGFLHELDYRKDSLVYDVMEMFRVNVIDRFVFRCIGLKIIAADDFMFDNGRCFFKEEAKKKFVLAYEQYISERADASAASILKQIETEVRVLSKEMKQLLDKEENLILQ